MKNKKLKSLCLSALLLLQLTILSLLSGCQLAIEEGDMPTEDRLAGVFVTTEYLDLFDMEAYVNDNLRVVGGEIAVEGNASEYYGRVYAEKTQTDEHRIEYEFTELNGFGYYSLIELGESMLDNYHYTGVDEGISDPKTHYKVTDEGEGVEMDGTLYFPADGRAAVFYFNPVYQTPEGDLYVTTGQGFSADTMVEGQIYSQTMEEVTTITMNGEKESWSTSVTTNIEGIRLPEKYVLIYMDGNSQILRSQEYAPGNVMPEMTIPADTAYLILEAHKLDSEGQPVVDREIVDRGEEHLSTFWINADGICIKGDTILTWN